MQVSDKLIKPLTEAKYLNADNVSRYRCIMRIFFEHYEKLKYWLYQEEVYEEMIKDPFFADYRPESAGSHNVDRMEESEYDPGYEKGGIH